MKKLIIAFVFSLTSLVPGISAAQGSAVAPTTTKDLQADAPTEYTVVKGDTLWGISGKFLKEPWKWPQIWQMNREQIKNPHLIYPGDIVRLNAAMLANGVAQLELLSQGAGGVVKLSPKTRVETLSSAIPTIPGSAIGPFLSQPLVADAGAFDAAPRIIATDEERMIVGSGTTVYVDGIRPEEGVNWQVYRRGEAIIDPDTGENLGTSSTYLGDAKVRRFGAPATIEITNARAEINKDDVLAPSREISFPSYVPRAPGKPINGRILGVRDGVVEISQYAIVGINKGSRDGVEVGFVLASVHPGQYANRGADFRGIGTLGLDLGFSGWEWRRNPVVPEYSAPNARSTGGAISDRDIKLPDERNGLLFVFRVFEKVSFALVMSSSRPLYVGDLVQSP
jgi:hypothetical protein